MNDLVRYQMEGTVAIVTLDDGKANALGHEMIAALQAALDRAEAEAQAVVLAGRPGRFCAGFDLKVLTAGRDVAAPLVRAGGSLFMRIYGLRLPVVAACTGHALAGGALVLLVSDVRIGVEGTFKLGLNEVAIGIPLPILVRRLADDRLEARRRVEATLLAGVYDPATAREVGYLDEVVVGEEALMARALERARELARLPPRAFATSKESMRRPIIDEIEAALADDVDRILQAGVPR